MRNVYTRSGENEEKDKYLPDRGHRGPVETVRVGESHECESGDHGLDLVGKSKKRTGEGTTVNEDPGMLKTASPTMTTR